MKKVYQLDSDGTFGREFFYQAETSHEAMEKHVYFLSLSDDKIKIEDIEPTLYGHALQVNDKTYWCKG